MGQLLKIAALDSSEADRKAADFVCSGQFDERVIRDAVAQLSRGGTIQLLDGNYYIDAFDGEDYTAVPIGFNDGNARVVNIIGDTENKSYNTHFGTVLHVTKRALDSLPDGVEGHVFRGTAQRPEAPGDFFTMTFVNNVNFENFYLYLYDASRPVVGLDCSRFGASEIRQVGVFTERFFFDRFLHEKPEAPCPGSVGIRTNIESNDEMARIGISYTDVGGLYTGYEFVGGDHMILQCCFAARCVYGYTFRQSYKTITFINCADEGNRYLPLFRNRGHFTAIDFNIERFDAAFIPDDVAGDRPYGASEETPGNWHGFISYTLQGKAFDLHSFWNEGSGINFTTVNQDHDRGCRPEYPEYLETVYDSAAGKMITWNGKNWIDALGNPVA